MAEVYFIDVAVLKEQSLIDNNVDNKLLLPTLVKVQDLYLQAILGTPLFEDLQTKITADPTLAGNANELLLMNKYIKKVLIYYVCMHTPAALKYRLMNKGAMVKSSDNAQAAEASELKVVKDDFRIDAEGYAELLTKYLKANTTLFPLYDDNTETGMNALGTNYTTGIDLS